ncbi:MAG: MFS transporter [Pirellulales bacterium]
MDTSASPRSGLTRTEWLICIIASIGFAFDIYELLMLPLIVRPALTDLGVATADFNKWVGLLFYIPALFGGIFGLVGGYLTDLLGRRRVLTWSILLYAFSAMAAGFSTSPEMLLFFRTTTFIGVCVEFVAAVAWLAELFPEPKRREAVLGYTQAFSSLGGILVTGAFFLAGRLGPHLPAIHGDHQAWRYTLISGVIPAIPLIFIRPFLPESPTWQSKKAAGTLKRPSFAELFKPQFRRTTIITALMFACSYGAAFGAIQHLPRIVPDIPSVAALPKPRQADVISAVQGWQEVGGLVGRFLLAFLAVRIVSRRNLLRVFQAPGLFLVPLVFLYPAVSNVGLLKVGIFFAGLLTVAQFSFWGNYLPRVYPLHLRGTGESFAANVGGRILGTSAALIITYTPLPQLMPGTSQGHKIAYAAAIVAFGVYLAGNILCFWLPEPAGEIED